MEYGFSFWLGVGILAALVIGVIVWWLYDSLVDVDKNKKGTWLL